jgi:hypothetical protein
VCTSWLEGSDSSRPAQLILLQLAHTLSFLPFSLLFFFLDRVFRRRPISYFTSSSSLGPRLSAPSNNTTYPTSSPSPASSCALPALGGSAQRCNVPDTDEGVRGRGSQKGWPELPSGLEPRLPPQLPTHTQVHIPCCSTKTLPSEICAQWTLRWFPGSESRVRTTEWVDPFSLTIWNHLWIPLGRKGSDASKRGQVTQITPPHRKGPQNGQGGRLHMAPSRRPARNFSQ